jgi:hypothetical protein
MSKSGPYSQASPTGMRQRPVFLGRLFAFVYGARRPLSRGGRVIQRRFRFGARLQSLV